MSLIGGTVFKLSTIAKSILNVSNSWGTNSLNNYEINKAFLIKTRPSERSRAISLLSRRKLKMYRQNQKEEQVSFVLICKVPNKNQIYPRQMAFQNSCIFLLFIFSCFVSVKVVEEGSGKSESASGINLPSFTYKINK